MVKYGWCDHIPLALRIKNIDAASYFTIMKKKIISRKPSMQGFNQSHDLEIFDALSQLRQWYPELKEIILYMASKNNVF